jgi:SAM-dependent methyltransferase
MITQCVLCGGRSFRVVRPGEFRLERCEQCALVQTAPRLDHAALAPYYETYAPHAEPAARSRSAATRHLQFAAGLPYRARFGPVSDVPEAPAPGACALDIGCAAGGYLTQLAKHGWEPWGLEPDVQTADTARRIVPEARIVVGTAEEADFERDAFDLVTLSHVLEHLQDPVAVLRKVHTWLRPGGTVRIWVPNFASVERRLFGGFWFGLDLPRHLFHFTPATLRHALEESGFRVRRTVPQLQGTTLSGSLAALAQSAVGRTPFYRRREPRWLYYLALPVSSMTCLLGDAAVIDVTAERA